MLTIARHARHAGLEGEELLAALDADAKARTLGELVADLQPLLHATATPDGPKARGLFAAARFLAGYTSYLMGQAEPALACMRLSTAWWGAPAGWHYIMAQIAAAAGEPTEAEYAYAAAIERDPHHRSAYIELMGLLSDRGDMAACRKLAAQAVAQSPPVQWTNEWQRPDHMMAGLRASAWHDPAEFPWCAMLEANAAVIRAELLAVVRSQRRRQERLQSGWEAVGTHQRAEFGTDRTLVSEGGSWREFVLLGEPDDDPEDQEARIMGGDPICGVVEANCRRCPRTAALLRSIPEVVSLAEAGLGEALFSSLAPGSKLRPHCGGTNTRLTCHLGLVLGSGKCGITCGGEERCWEEGKCLVFDDSFEHEVYHEKPATTAASSSPIETDTKTCQPKPGNHDCDGERVVLLIRFWHPDLSQGSSNRWVEALEDVEGAIISQMEAALPRVSLQETNGPSQVQPQQTLDHQLQPNLGSQEVPEPEPEPEPVLEPDPAAGPNLMKFSVEHPSHAQVAAAAEAAVRIEERAQRLAAYAPGRQEMQPQDARAEIKRAAHCEDNGVVPAVEPLPPQDHIDSESDVESDVSSGVD